MPSSCTETLSTFCPIQGALANNVAHVPQKLRNMNKEPYSLQGRWHLLALALVVSTLHTTAASPLKSRPRQDGAGGGAAPGSLSPPVDPKGGGQITPPPPTESGKQLKLNFIVNL